MYAAFGTRDSGIPRDSQALISGFLRICLKCGIFPVYCICVWLTANILFDSMPGAALRPFISVVLKSFFIAIC
ncbi:uncharacterized protein Dvar_44340 [Desulfosarcina variabilis str. Montpellier]